jgi:serine acetyltransferase
MTYLDYIYYHCGIRALHRVLHCITKGFSMKLVLFNDVDVTKCPRSTKFPHPVGMVIGVESIGTNCTIYQGTTIGQRVPSGRYPTLGDHVIIYSSCIILGDISIGDNAIIGAGSIVLKDVPANRTIIGVWK